MPHRDLDMATQGSPVQFLPRPDCHILLASVSAKTNGSHLIHVTRLEDIPSIIVQPYSTSSTFSVSFLYPGAQGGLLALFLVLDAHDQGVAQGSHIYCLGRSRHTTSALCVIGYRHCGAMIAECP